MTFKQEVVTKALAIGSEEPRSDHPTYKRTIARLPNIK